MKILYDHQAFTFQYFGGVSKCFCELISHRPGDVDVELAIAQSNNVHLREAGLAPDCKPVSIDFNHFMEGRKFKGKHTLYRCLQRLPFFHAAEKENLKRSIQLLERSDYDVFHPTFFDSYFLDHMKGKPWVITVHDMMPELYPQYFRQDDGQIVFKKKYLDRASAIIAVSENTKNDLVRILGVPEDKITVIYHGGPKVETLEEPALIDAPYILYVGTRNAYKNFPQTLKDFAIFHKRHQDIKLVCTGSTFSDSETAMISSLGIASAVEHKRADNKQLKNLYAHALAFVYPSLYEGFGMPILEAFAYGCPVLLNRKSCFPEIAADAGIYFNSEPGNSNLAEALEDILSLSTAERQRIKEKGHQHLECFSWEKSAKKLAEVYRRVM